MRHRLVSLAAVTAACAATASACSGSSPQAIYSSVYSNTMAAKSALLNIQLSEKSGANTQSQKIGGGVDFAKPAAQLDMMIAGNDMSIVEVGKDLYIQIPPPDRGATGGKEWVETQDTSASPTDPTGLLASDPSSMLGILQPKATDITRVGAARLGGVDTTEYKATVQLANSSDSGSNGAWSHLLGSLSTKSLPVEVWVDSRGRLRQLTTSLVISKLPASVSGASAPTLPITIAVKLSLTNFGTKVSTQVPPASQVIQVPFSVIEHAVSSPVLGPQ